MIGHVEELVCASILDREPKSIIDPRVVFTPHLDRNALRYRKIAAFPVSMSGEIEDRTGGCGGSKHRRLFGCKGINRRCDRGCHHRPSVDGLIGGNPGGSIRLTVESIVYP